MGIFVTISASESPAYQFQAYVIHQLQYPSETCEDEYQAAVTQNLNNFEIQMTGLIECNNIFWEIITYSASKAKGSTEVSKAQVFVSKVAGKYFSNFSKQPLLTIYACLISIYAILSQFMPLLTLFMPLLSLFMAVLSLFMTVLSLFMPLLSLFMTVLTLFMPVLTLFMLL